MWYKNERHKTPLQFADSPDLYRWTPRGVAIADRAGEGAKVFRWKDRYWLIADVWKGLGVYSSDDCERWTKQEGNLLEEPGTAPTDRSRGGHADVVVSGDRAYLFYFVHQGGPDAAPGDATWQRRTVIQVVELEHRNGRLTCDRNKPTHILLRSPATAR